MAVGRGLTWGLPLVVKELRTWRASALDIPSGPIQAIALDALAGKRGNTHGAAFFAVLPDVRSRPLLRLLVTYQVLWDFLDSITESRPELTHDDVLCLHRALVDAVDPGRPPAKPYGPASLAGAEGYLAELIDACRAHCERLPSFAAVAPTLHVEACRVGVQAVNHSGRGADRESTLRAWVDRECPGMSECHWFELAAAAGANLVIYALFALAAGERCSHDEVARIQRAYFPWSGALATMLDSFVDQFDDRLRGDHCYVSYYGTAHEVEQGVCRLVRRSLEAKRGLRRMERHVLVTAAMVAMYLSRDSARSEALRRSARQIGRAGGLLTRTLLPVLRLWRIASRSRAT